MASSVSSECALSSATLTVTKCCNHLKANVAKALQSLKLAIKQDWLAQEQGLLRKVEEALLQGVKAEQAVTDCVEVCVGRKGAIQIMLDLDSDCKEDIIVDDTT